MDYDANQYDPWQPLEILGGQCIGDYFLHNPEQIKKFCDDAKEEFENMIESKKKQFSRKSIIDGFLANQD